MRIQPSAGEPGAASSDNELKSTCRATRGAGVFRPLRGSRAGPYGAPDSGASRALDVSAEESPAGAGIAHRNATLEAEQEHSCRSAIETHDNPARCRWWILARRLSDSLWRRESSMSLVICAGCSRHIK